MDLKKITGMALTALALNTLVLTDVLADSVETKCRVRANRSKVSVDAEGLARGNYYATVTSGGVTISSKPTDVQSINSSGDEVEFDFDSNTNDIAEGATEIPVDFIVDKLVLGAIYNADTDQLVEDDGAKCRAKKRRGRDDDKGGRGRGRGNGRGGNDDGPNHS